MSSSLHGTVKKIADHKVSAYAGIANPKPSRSVNKYPCIYLHVHINDNKTYSTAIYYNDQCNILKNKNESGQNLPFRFTLCMQELFDSIPENQWKIKDTEEFAITKFKDRIIEQIA